MNDEIREIEEWLKDISTPTGLSYSGDRTLSNSMVDKIIDYITNLQKENEKLRMRNDMLRKDIDSFIQDNKIDYKSRVEKAIEYIDRETGKGIYESGYGRGTAITICKEHLLNILQNGSDDND